MEGRKTTLESTNIVINFTGILVIHIVISSFIFFLYYYYFNFNLGQRWTECIVNVTVTELVLFSEEVSLFKVFSAEVSPG